jgi:hypothetical protein
MKPTKGARGKGKEGIIPQTNPNRNMRTMLGSFIMKLVGVTKIIIAQSIPTTKLSKREIGIPNPPVPTSMKSEAPFIIQADNAIVHTGSFFAMKETRRIIIMTKRILSREYLINSKKILQKDSTQAFKAMTLSNL